MIRRINFFGGPGSGKSTTAAWLFSELKTNQQEFEVELVTEFVKSWAIMKRPIHLFDQVYLSGKQMHSEYRFLSHGIDVIITDSPVFLGGCYSDFYNPDLQLGKHIHSICDEYEKKFPSLNIFLDRQGKPYRDKGRYQTHEQAVTLDNLIKTQMINRNMEFVTIPYHNRKGIYLEVEKALQKNKDEGTKE